MNINMDFEINLLAILFIAILWIMYGLYALMQAREHINRRIRTTSHSKGEYWFGTAFLYITFAPLVFVIKALYGAFKRYR